MLRKVLIMTLLMLLVGSFSVWADTTYEIETKYGVEQVIIPDGYTAEEVLLIVAKNYYELNHEHEELLTEVESLNASVKEYIEANRELREKYLKTLNDYDTLVKDLEKYNKWSNFQGFVGGAINYDFKDTYGFGIKAGMFLFNKTLMTIGVSFPFSVEVGVGFVF